MSISTAKVPPTYDATSGQTVFPIPFPFFDPVDIIVKKNGVVLTQLSDYTITGGGDNTGNVTLTVGAALHDAIIVDRYTTEIQPYVFRNQGQYFAKEHESAMDRIMLVIQDLADFGALMQSLLGSLIYDLNTFYLDAPGNGVLMARWILIRTVNFPANLTGSRAGSKVAATASTVLTIKKNGTSVGTITFGAGSASGTFASSGFGVVIGDVVTVENQATADATLECVSITLAGVRTP
jgi:hypothetical protein